MAGPLVVCSACSTHVLARESTCPHCGASLRGGTVLGRTATAMLMGLSLAGCPADDDPMDTMGGGGSSSSASTTMSSDSASTTSSSTDSASTIDEDTSGSTFGGGQSAYGSPDSETFGTTDMTDSDTTTSSGGDTDTDTDTEGSSSTTLSPLYGAVPSD